MTQKTTISAGSISIPEANEFMELACTMYPNDFFKMTPETDSYRRRVALWQNQLSTKKVCKEDAINSLMYINANDPSTRMPTVARVIIQAEVEKKKRLGISGPSKKRIETPEEVSYNMVFKQLRNRMNETELNDVEKEIFKSCCFNTIKYIRDYLPAEHRTEEHENDFEFAKKYINYKEIKNEQD